MKNLGMFTILSKDGIGVKMISDKIVEKLSVYPDDVRELAMQAIRLSESYPEAAVADQLQAVVRKLTKRQEGDGQ